MSRIRSLTCIEVRGRSTRCGSNDVSRVFWERVISTYTGGEYEKARQFSDGFDRQFITFDNSHASVSSVPHRRLPSHQRFRLWHCTPKTRTYLLFRGRPTTLITSAEHYGAVMNQDFDLSPISTRWRRASST